MITIDDIRLMLSNTRERVADMEAEGYEAFESDTRNIEVFSLALSQHGEIERLRADQAECNAGNEWQAREIEKLKRERDEAYE